MVSEGRRRALQQTARLSLLWFRYDLRVDDHPALTAAYHASKGRVVPVFIIDPRDLEPNELGWPGLGYQRALFLIECLTDLRSKLKRLGSDLIMLRGESERALVSFAERVGAAQVYTHEAMSAKEGTRVDIVRRALEREGVELSALEGPTLYHRSRTPFREDLSDLPRDFLSFRRALERSSAPRPPELPIPKLLPLPIGVSPGKLPTVGELGHELVKPDSRAELKWIGGEAQALKRLKAVIWERELLDHCHSKRRALSGEGTRPHLASWLNFGCLSPRRVWYEALAFEAKRGQSLGVYQLIYHLTSRDFLIFHAQRGRYALYDEAGLFPEEGSSPPPIAPQLFEAWWRGYTGFPLVDACMRSLAATGTLSPQGRLIAASFFVKQLGLSWRLGALCFESMLRDYCPAITWGWFQSLKGLGPEFSEPAVHPVWAGKTLDWEGSFVKRWVPELANLPSEALYEPYILDEQWQAHFGIQLGVTYPYPIVAPPPPPIPGAPARQRLLERVWQRFPPQQGS